MALGLTQPLTEMSTRDVYGGQRRPVRRADNLTTFMCRLSWNLGVSTSRNHQGLSRPVMGLLYVYVCRYVHKFDFWLALKETPHEWWAVEIRPYSYTHFLTGSMFSSDRSLECDWPRPTLWRSNAFSWVNYSIYAGVTVTITNGGEVSIKLVTVCYIERRFGSSHTLNI